jgi:hypothetical protein
MQSDRDHLQALVDGLPDSMVPAAISFLSELSDQEIVDAETLASPHAARDVTRRIVSDLRS